MVLSSALLIKIRQFIHSTAPHLHWTLSLVFKTARHHRRMASNDQTARSRTRRWLRRVIPESKDVESGQDSRLGSVTYIDDSPPAPYQVLDTPEDSQSSEKVGAGLSTISEAPIVQSLTSSPTLSPLPFGLQVQPRPQVDLLTPPRPVLTARTSSNYFTPADIYSADPNIHPDGIYSNDDSAL
jgi:hypothetical protein